MKVLFISKDYNLRKDGGCAVTKRNIDMIRQIFDEVVELQIPVPSIFTRVKNMLLREEYGSTNHIRKLLDNYLRSNWDLVFCDSSLYGGYLRKFSSKDIITCCFYHNVERKFYRDKYKISKKIQDKIIIPYVDYCERLSTNSSRYIITLNERDSSQLQDYYGREADFIFPTSFEAIDVYSLMNIQQCKINTPYALFVGSNFFPNVQGLDFLFKEVAPFVQCDIRIVGSVCGAFKNRILPSNVVLEGVVDNLTPYYLHASCVVSPIFSGSGLKTKTIEALRFGKTFIGTNESLVGILPENYTKIGYLCNTAGEFINAINKASSINTLVNEESLRLFNEEYSNQAQFVRFKEFILQITRENVTI